MERERERVEKGGAGGTDLLVAKHVLVAHGVV